MNQNRFLNLIVFLVNVLIYFCTPCGDYRVWYCVILVNFLPASVAFQATNLIGRCCRCLNWRILTREQEAGI